jgi:hypothetical protein
LIGWWLVLAGAAVQPQVGSAETPPENKSCPGGLIIRASDSCPPSLPDHRYQFTHEPPRQVTTVRWWCGRSAQPHEASLSIEQRQPTTPAGALTHVRRLVALTIEGRPASPAMLKTVKDRVAELDGLYDLYGRCLAVPDGRTLPMLVLRHFADGRQQSAEITLR